MMHVFPSQEQAMSQAKSGDSVKIHYTGTLDDGTQFDSSAGREPLAFKLGSGQVIPGFDKAVEGMVVGDSKSVNISAEDAYGPHNDQMVQDVPRSALPDDLTPEIGMGLQAQGPDGQVANLVVTAVEDESITVDGNHPLAGKALNFDIELVSID
jgi:peptidylprolyl isomerase